MNISTFSKFNIYLQVVYCVIVLFSLISISKPYHLSVQILFYTINGFFLIGYLWFEVDNWTSKRKKSRPFVEPKALSYTRTMATTVIVSLAFSAFSGYKNFDSFYSYNVKSHLFLFVSNMLLFMLKFKLIFGFNILIGQLLSYFIMLAFIGVVVIYFEQKT